MQVEVVVSRREARSSQKEILLIYPRPSSSFVVARPVNRVDRMNTFFFSTPLGLFGRQTNVYCSPMCQLLGCRNGISHTARKKRCAQRPQNEATATSVCSAPFFCFVLNKEAPPLHLSPEKPKGNQWGMNCHEAAHRLPHISSRFRPLHLPCNPLPHPCHLDLRPNGRVR